MYVCLYGHFCVVFFVEVKQFLEGNFVCKSLCTKCVGFVGNVLEFCVCVCKKSGAIFEAAFVVSCVGQTR